MRGKMAGGGLYRGRIATVRYPSSRSANSGLLQLHPPIGCAQERGLVVEHDLHRDIF